MKDRYFEAPTYANNLNQSVFLGGGITGCPDWQKTMTDEVFARSELVMFNPRRANWDFGNQIADDHVQIKWEFLHLRQADIHLYWFPADSICPIALFELGKSLGQGRKVLVGTDPDYPRRRDVLIQCALEDSAITVYDNLYDLIDALVLFAQPADEPVDPVE